MTFLKNTTNKSSFSLSLKEMGPTEHGRPEVARAQGGRVRAAIGVRGMNHYRLCLTIAIIASALAPTTAQAVGFHGGGMGGGFHGGIAGGMGGGFHGGIPGGMGSFSPSIGGFGGYGGMDFHGGTGGGFIGGLDPNFAGGPAARGLATYGGMGLPANIARPSYAPGSVNTFGALNGFDHGGIPGLAPQADARTILGETPTSADVGNFLGLKDGGPQLGALRSEIARNPLLAETNPQVRSGGTMPAENRLAPPNLNPADDPLMRGSAWANGHAGNFPTWSGGQAEVPRGNAAKLNSNIMNTVAPGGPHSDQIHNWADNHPERMQSLQQHADQVRQNWNQDNNPWRGNVRPGSDWWSKYHPNLDHWYYHHDWWNHPWNYWWGFATWDALGAWFPTWGWTEPVYYDYGPGGNVVYQDNNVYVNGTDVGSDADYAESAAQLATVDPSQEEATDDTDQWLPLGTFAVETSASETSTTRQLQLAVDKAGIISGTMHNSSTDKMYVVQGRVDKQTQRAAFTIGDKSDVVMETGIFNLTKPQTQVLVHFGPSKTETYLLVRLDPPKEAGGDASSNAGQQPAENPLAE